MDSTSSSDNPTIINTPAPVRAPGNVPQPVKETVTSLTAKSLHPGEAAKKIFKEQGSFYFLWQVWTFLLEALGYKQKKIDADYEHISLDEVAARGNFPYRPSDLFLKVVL